VKDIMQPNTQKDPMEYFQMGLNTMREMVKEITGTDITADQEAQAFIVTGGISESSGDWDQALESYQRALELCKADEIKGEALKQTGHVRSRLGEWE